MMSHAERRIFHLALALLAPALLALVAFPTACSRPGAEQVPRETAVQPQAGDQARVVVLASQAQKDSGIETMELRQRVVAETVHATARLTNDENNTWRVGAITEGRIVEVLANPGDSVEKDQVLARMHSHEIHESRAEYQKALANLGRLKGVADYAVRVRDRAKRLYDLKAASLEQLERAETELRNAMTDAGNAEIELARTRNHLTEFLGVDADDPRTGKPVTSEEGDLIPVRSPATGIVLTRAVTPGTVVTPASDQFLISDLSKIWAIVEVREDYLARLRPGMLVRIYVQAYAQEAFVGRIGKIGDVLDPATRTVKVRVELPNAKKRLKPEMYATAEIDLGAGSTALLVPAEAVQEVQGQPSVFVQTSADKFEVRPVKTGRPMDNDVEITGAVKPGDRVAVRAAFVLKSEFLKATLGREE